MGTGTTYAPVHAVFLLMQPPFLKSIVKPPCTENRYKYSGKEQVRRPWGHTGIHGYVSKGSSLNEDIHEKTDSTYLLHGSRPLALMRQRSDHQATSPRLTGHDPMVKEAPKPAASTKPKNPFYIWLHLVQLPVECCSKNQPLASLLTEYSYKLQHTVGCGTK